MKKLFALLLALTMVFSLAACGGGDDEKTPSSDDNTPSSSEQQEQENKAPEANPVEDEPEGTPNEDSSNASSGDMFEWIDNDLTAGIPVPDFGVMTGSVPMPLYNTYTAKYMEVADADVTAYITSLKEAGWNGEQDGEEMNITFRATAADGRSMILEYRMGLLAITISKEEDGSVAVEASAWENATVDPDKAADFADLTSGIPEPTSTYEINSIADKRMFGLNFRFENEADAKAWEQLVIGSSFTLASEKNGYRTYENDTHTVRIGSLDATICNKQ